MNEIEWMHQLKLTICKQAIWLHSGFHTLRNPHTYFDRSIKSNARKAHKHHRAKIVWDWRLECKECGTYMGAIFQCSQENERTSTIHILSYALHQFRIESVILLMMWMDFISPIFPTPVPWLPISSQKSIEINREILFHMNFLVFWLNFAFVSVDIAERHVIRMR